MEIGRQHVLWKYGNPEPGADGGQRSGGSRNPRARRGAIGAQLPYDLGMAEANAALYALLGKTVTPYVSIAAVGAEQAKLSAALEMVTKRNLPKL